MHYSGDSFCDGRRRAPARSGAARAVQIANGSRARPDKNTRAVGPPAARPSRRQAAGFSLAELLIAVCVLLIMVALAATIFPSMYAGLRADSSWESLMALLRTTRQQALTQRRTYQITFTAPDQVQVARVELNGALTNEPLWTLPNHLTFTLFAGEPDTPDAFGNGQPIDFVDGTGGTAGDTLYFRSDGSIVDATGNFVNGTLFIGQSGQIGTARAITMMGATGIFHGYRYDVSTNSFQ